MLSFEDLYKGIGRLLSGQTWRDGLSGPPPGMEGPEGCFKEIHIMAEENVKEKVIDIICKLLEVPREKVTMEARYAEDLGADSLDTAELVLEFEDVFKISVPEDAEGRIRTVGETVKFIEEELAKKKAAAS